MRIYKNEHIDFIISRIHNTNHIYHTSLKASPNEMIHYSSIFDSQQRQQKDRVKKLISDRKRKEGEKIDKKIADNKNFDLKIGDLVLVKTFSDDKLSNIFEGPYTIKTIELKNNRLQIENFRVLRWESLRNIKRFYAEEGVSVVQPDLNLSDNVNLSDKL